MSDNLKELHKIIFENDNPEEALKIALELIYAFSMSHESPQGTSSETPQVVA